MYEAIVKGLAQILSFRDDQGEPLNEGAREFLVMVPMNFLAATLVSTGGSDCGRDQQSAGRRRTVPGDLGGQSTFELD